MDPRGPIRSRYRLDVLRLWLIYAEIEIIGSICLYCTAVHITTFALLIVLTVVCPAQLGWTKSRAS